MMEIGTQLSSMLLMSRRGWRRALNPFTLLTCSLSVALLVYDLHLLPSLKGTRPSAFSDGSRGYEPIRPVPVLSPDMSHSCG